MVVNKIDLPADNRLITDEQIQNKAQEIEGQFFKVSAKASDGLEELFNQIACDLHGITLEQLNQQPVAQTEVSCKCILI